MTEKKTIADEIDYTDAMVAIPLTELVAMENAFFLTKAKVEVAVLAANPEKKQKAIEEALEILKEVVDVGG